MLDRWEGVAAQSAGRGWPCPPLRRRCASRCWTPGSGRRPHWRGGDGPVGPALTHTLTLCVLQSPPLSLQMPSVSPPPSSLKPSLRSDLTQQAASVLFEMNVSPKRSPTIIFGHKSVTAFKSADSNTALVSTVQPFGEPFGSLDIDVGEAGGHKLLRDRFQQLNNLTSLQTTVHSGGPWQRLSFSHIISIVPPRLDDTITQYASDVIVDCYSACVKSAENAQVTTLVFPLLCSGRSKASTPLSFVTQAALTALSRVESHSLSTIFVLCKDLPVLSALLSDATDADWTFIDQLPADVVNFFGDNFSGKQVFPPSSPTAQPPSNKTASPACHAAASLTSRNISPSEPSQSGHFGANPIDTNTPTTASPRVPSSLPRIVTCGHTAAEPPFSAPRLPSNVTDDQRRRMECNKVQAQSRKKQRVHKSPSSLGPPVASPAVNPHPALPPAPKPLLVNPYQSSVISTCSHLPNVSSCS